jgi:hypothetical protein
MNKNPSNPIAQSPTLSGLPEWLTVEQLCEKFPWFTKNSIYYLSHQQRSPHFKIRGRLLFRSSEILAWIEEQRVCP